MALTKADKEFIELTLKPVFQTLEQYKEINEKQDERLEKLEDISIERGKLITSMDEWHKTRDVTCPHNTRISKVENTQENQKVTRKFIIKIGAIFGGVIAAVWGVIQIVGFIIG